MFSPNKSLLWFSQASLGTAGPDVPSQGACEILWPSLSATEKHRVTVWTKDVQMLTGVAGAVQRLCVLGMYRPLYIHMQGQQSHTHTHTQGGICTFMML